MKPLLVLDKDWEESKELTEMKKRFGGSGVLFSLRMMIDIAKSKNRQIAYNVDMFSHYIKEYHYNKEELYNLLDYSIKVVELFHKVSEGDKFLLKCPLMESKYLFKTKKK